MSSESIVQRTTELAFSPPVARTRRGLWLTAAERKYLLMAVDLLLVNGALLAAVTLWNDFLLTPQNIVAHYKWFVTLSILWLVVGAMLDIYNLARSASTSAILVSIGVASGASALVYLGIPWLTPPLLHRSYALAFVVLAISTTVMWRVLYVRVLAQPAFRRRSLVLGSAGTNRELFSALRLAGQGDDANPFRGTGYHVLGVVVATAGEVPTHLDGVRVLGEARDLVHLVRQYGADEIVVALDDERALTSDAYEALLDCRELGFEVRSLTDVYEQLTGRLPVDYARRDVRLMLGQADSPGSRVYAALKRLVDIVLALLGLAIMVQILPAIALANLIWSPGPLFYRQQRVGKGGRPFAVLKFRSMVVNAESCTGAVWCGDRDPRITPLGHVMRKTRLDELPQFINILRGEMSIVGPRPERPHFVGQLARVLPLYRARHAVKPGLTGWAQVHYGYGNSVEDSRIKLEYDLYYVKRASLYLDLLTMLQTVRVVLGLRGK